MTPAPVPGFMPGIAFEQIPQGKSRPMTEHFDTGSKKPGRGMAQRSLDLIEAMRDIAQAAQPITGRGVGYKLFTKGLITSMARSEMARVYRLLLTAREQELSRGTGSSTRPAALRRSRLGKIRKPTRVLLPVPTAATSGISSRCGSKSGPRKVPFAVFCSRYSTTSRSAFG